MQPNQSSDIVADILVVGGGPVGVLAARLLSDAGLKIAIADPLPPETGTFSGDANEEMACHSPRVYALSEATESLLASAGLGTDLLDYAPCPYDAIEVWDEQGSERIHFACEDAGLVHFGHIVHHDILMNLLWSDLDQNPDLNILAGEKLESLRPEREGIWVGFSSGLTLKARLVIGADGANSKVRELAQLPTRQWDYKQKATVVTAELASPHRNVARQVFTQNGALGILPVGSANPGRVVIVWSTNNAHAQTLADAPEAQFSSMLAQALEIPPNQITKLWQRQQFPLTHCHAKTWVMPGLALAGDAAHSIHPLAGQGLNLGFEDVALLVSLIRKTLRRSGATQARFGELNLLRRYQRTRKHRVYGFIALTEGFNSCFQRQEAGLVTLRNFMLRIANRSDLFKSVSMAIASGVIPPDFTPGNHKNKKGDT